MDRIILIGVDQGVMIGGRFDGWLAQLTEAGWITIRKLEEADPYEALPDALRSSQSMELGAVGPATGPRQDQALHDAETRRRKFMANFPVINPEAFIAASPALEDCKARLADANPNPASSDLSSLRKGAEDELRNLRFHFANRVSAQHEDLMVEALAEIKATVDGESSQPVRDIVYGLLDEIAALPDHRAALVSGSREDGANAP